MRQRRLGRQTTRISCRKLDRQPEVRINTISSVPHLLLPCSERAGAAADDGRQGGWRQHGRRRGSSRRSPSLHVATRVAPTRCREVQVRIIESTDGGQLVTRQRDHVKRSSATSCLQQERRRQCVVRTRTQQTLIHCTSRMIREGNSMVSGGRIGSPS